MEPKKLETKRLLLRWYEFTDTDFVIKLLNESSFIKNIGDRGIRNAEDAKKHIQKIYDEQYRRLGFGSFIVETKEPRQPIGICSLLKRDWLGDVDIGFAYLESQFGKGYATEAAKAVVEYVRTELKITRLVGITLVENIPSQRVLEKLGMKFEKMIKFPEFDKEDNLYSINF